MTPVSHACPACGHENPEKAKFCLQCGQAFALRCSKCAKELPAGARFCLECGAEIRLLVEVAAPTAW